MAHPACPPRDLVGYGAASPDPAWPNGARLALKLVVNYEEGAELPYWTRVADRPHLVICHTLDCNDSRFSRAQGFDRAKDFCAYMTESFDTLYAEGETSPCMMTVAVHPRLIGRPGRIRALARFLDHVAKHDKVWIGQRNDLARHWIEKHACDS